MFVNKFLPFQMRAPTFNFSIFILREKTRRKISASKNSVWYLWKRNWQKTLPTHRLTVVQIRWWLKGSLMEFSESVYVVYCINVRIQRGDRGSGPPPPEKSQKIEFLAILVRIPCETTKLPSQLSMLGHHQPASETPFRWRADGGPLIVVFGASLPSSTTKKVVKVGPPLKKLWKRPDRDSSLIPVWPCPQDLYNQTQLQTVSVKWYGVIPYTLYNLILR